MVCVQHVLKTWGQSELVLPWGWPQPNNYSAGESEMKEKHELKAVGTIANQIGQQEAKVLQPSSSTRQEIKEILQAIRSNNDTSHQFLLRVVQPGLAGLMDGSVSTLAPIFATAFATHNSFFAFLVGMASATGA